MILLQTLLELEDPAQRDLHRQVKNLVELAFSKPGRIQIVRLLQGNPRGALPPAFQATYERREIQWGYEPRCMARGLPVRMPSRRSKGRSLRDLVPPNLPGRERPRLAGVLARRLHWQMSKPLESVHRQLSRYVCTPRCSENGLSCHISI